VTRARLRPSLAALASALALAGCALLSPGGSRLAHWKAETEALRELSFARDGIRARLGLARSLRLRWITADEIPEISRDEVRAKLPPGVAEAYRDAYSALGVFPPDLDLLAALTELHQDQLVGVYSPRDRTLYVVKDLPAHVDGGAELIVVHELVHALQHEHFPFAMALLEGLGANDDVLSALATAIEGDASYTMLGSSLGTDARIRAVAAEDARRSWQADMDAPSGALATIPRLLRNSLLFPYAHGIVLASRRFEARGNAGLDDLVRSPPLSTGRVLHPEDADPVEFIRLPEAEIESELAERECRLGQSNVAGVLTIDVLFRDHGRKSGLGRLTSRWSGDRFLHVACPDGPELVWVTRWDDDASARRFAEQYAGLAPSIARLARLSGPPAVALEGRTAVVVSPRLADQVERVLAGMEVRAYPSFDAWRDGDCFPSGCPGEVP
jgi:hypothetical protein